VKKLIVLSLVIAAMPLAGGFFIPSHAQANTPTFYRLVPGTYVNGWPRFTISYPKGWIEHRPRFDEVFRAAAPGSSRYPALEVIVGPWPLPRNKFVDTSLPLFRALGRDVTVVTDKPSRLRNGTSAREVEFQYVNDGTPINWLGLVTKKGDIWIHADVGSPNGKIGEDLRAIPYSIEFQPGGDERVKLPPDVQKFLDKWCTDLMSRDVTKIVAYYSDRYLESGWKKGQWVQFVRDAIGPITSVRVGITDFQAAGDRAYLAGYIYINSEKTWLHETSLIKQNGGWRWYGNQRDAAPLD